MSRFTKGHHGLISHLSHLCQNSAQIKMQYVHFKFKTDYFLLPWKIPEENSLQQLKISIYQLPYHDRQPNKIMAYLTFHTVTGFSL